MILRLVLLLALLGGTSPHNATPEHMTPSPQGLDAGTGVVPYWPKPEPVIVIVVFVNGHPLFLMIEA